MLRGSFCFPHVDDVSAFVVVIFLCLLYVSLWSRVLVFLG